VVKRVAADLVPGVLEIVQLSPGHVVGTGADHCGVDVVRAGHAPAGEQGQRRVLTRLPVLESQRDDGVRRPCAGVGARSAVVTSKGIESLDLPDQPLALSVEVHLQGLALRAE